MSKYISAGRLRLKRMHDGRHWNWTVLYTETYCDILCGSARTWDDAVRLGLRYKALHERMCGGAS